MLSNPRMINCEVIGDEVQHELQTSLSQTLTEFIQRLITAQGRINLVTIDRIRRSGDIRGLIFSENTAVIGNQSRGSLGDRSGLRAACPYAHQPDPVEAVFFLELFYFRFRDIRQR